MKKLPRRSYKILSGLIFCVSILFFECGSGPTTEVFFNNRKIVLQGGASHSTMQEDNALRITIDNHNIVIGEQQLTLNGVTSQTPDFEEILVTIDGGLVRGIPGDKNCSRHPDR